MTAQKLKDEIVKMFVCVSDDLGVEEAFGALHVAVMELECGYKFRMSRLYLEELEKRQKDTASEPPKNQDPVCPPS